MPNAMVIDLSHHNANTDFARIRAAGVVGVIHKETQGIGFVDSAYAQRKTAALQAGLLWGAYHFGTADNVAAQVAHFINTTNPDGSFVLVLDFEKNELSPADSMSLAQAKDFLTAVQTRSGQRPKIYTGMSYMIAAVGPQPEPTLATYRVWWRNTPTRPICIRPGRIIGCGNTPTARMGRRRNRSTAWEIATATLSTATKPGCAPIG
jgi:lysozyme